MKFDEKKRFYKSKGFYISCFLGLFAVLSVVTVQKNMEQNKLAQLETKQESTELSDNDIIEEASAEDEHTFDTVNEDPKQEPMDIAAAETSAPTAAPKATKEPADTESVPKSDAAITTAENKKEDTEESVAVLNADDVEQGLTWPVNGKIDRKSTRLNSSHAR